MDGATRRSPFEDLAERSRRLVAAGNVQQAVEAYRQAASAARERGDAERALLAEASVAALLVEVEPNPPQASRLRAIFTESREARTRHVAGLALSRHYHARGEGRKALFYARAAHQSDDPTDRWAASHQVGVMCLACSRPQEGLPWLRQALDGWRADRAPIALSTGTLAYAASLVRSPEARPFLATSEALLREEAAVWPIYRPSVHASLGFAYLLRQRPEEAHAHARAALLALDGLPQRHESEHRAALYLAGEAAAELGETDEAEARFEALLVTYYPGSRHFRDWLVWVRTAGMVNWLA